MTHPAAHPMPLSRRSVVQSGAIAASAVAVACGARPPATPAPTSATPYDTFATGLRFTHNALRRNLATVRRVSAQGDDRSDTFLEFVGLFGEFLASHHHGEDAFLFPTLRQHTAGRSADAAFLEARQTEHHQVERLLEQLRRATGATRGTSSLAAIRVVADELQALLEPHLLAEEQALTPEHLATMLPASAMAEAQRQRLDHDKQGGATLLMLYVHSLSSGEQQALLGREPWFFRKVLVGWAWGGRYERFLPYSYNADLNF